jgi:hypothetical protein
MLEQVTDGSAKQERIIERAREGRRGGMVEPMHRLATMGRKESDQRNPTSILYPSCSAIARKFPGEIPFSK